jgi:hypothetical protein
MRFRDCSALRLALITAVALIFLVANSAPAQEEDPFDYLRKDERLSAEVTLRLNGEALKDVVDVLEAATGAKISVDPDIAEDKVTIFCKGQPASEVMVQIAKLFGYHFRPERIAGDRRYTLFRDDATRALERKLRRGAIDEAFEKIGDVVGRYAQAAATQEGYEEARKAAASRMRELMDMPEPRPEDLTDEFIDKMAPIVEEMSYATFGLAHRSIPLMYTRLTQSQIEMLKDGRRVVFSSYEYPGAFSMPSDIAKLVEETGTPFDAMMLMGDESGGTDYGDYADEFDESGDDESGPVTGVRLEFRCDTQEVGMKTLMLYAQIGRLHEDQSEETWTDGFLAVPVGEDFGEMLKRSIDLYRQMEAPETTREPESAEPEDPLMQTEVKVSRHFGWLADDLEGLYDKEESEEPDIPEQRTTSKASPGPIFRERGLYTASHLIEDMAHQVPVSMIADHYDKMLVVPSMGKTLGQHVAALEAAGSDFTRDGDWFRFRSRTWYAERPIEIPNHLILRWIDAEKRKSGFDLTDLAEMAALTRDQLQNLVGYGASGLRWVFDSLQESYISESDWQLIRAFALCSVDQQRRLLQGAGIPLRAMPREAQESLVEALQEMSPEGWTADKFARSAFFVSAGKRHSYTLHPGATQVKEALENSYPIEQEDFDEMLDYLKSLDPSITIDSFDVSEYDAAVFSLDSGDWSERSTVTLPHIEKPEASEEEGE